MPVESIAFIAGCFIVGVLLGRGWDFAAGALFLTLLSGLGIAAG